MKRRMTSLLLALALTLAMCLTAQPALAAEGWDGTAATEYAGGSGTQEDPYLIATPGQLTLFRDQVNGGKPDICAKIVADIDLNNDSWTPIGLNETGYTGAFDGGGWAIKNMKLDQLSPPVHFVQPNGRECEYTVAGLFGIVGVPGTVKYVHVDGVITGNISSSEATYLGGVAGLSTGTVEECFATCSYTDVVVSCSDNIGIGGVVGLTFSGGVIKNCYYIGSMGLRLKTTNYSGSYRQYIGGVVGYTIGEVANCYAVVQVNSISTNGSENLRTGGVAGVSWDRDTIKNSYCNEMKVLFTNVAGSMYSSTFPFAPEGCAKLSTEELKDWNMPGKLGSAYRYDSENVNDGYPVLAVMTYGEEAKEDSWYTKELTEHGMTEEELNALVPTALWNKDLTKNVTRAEFAAIALNLYEQLLGTKVTVQIDNPFTDTSNTDIIKAYQLGITMGTSPTTFDPYINISRQDMATMLTRVYKKLYIPGWTLAGDGDYKLDYTMPQKFLDHERIADYAVDSVYYMASQGIIKGSDGYFNPFASANGSTVGNATREQAIITSIRYYSVNRDK